MKIFHLLIFGAVLWATACHNDKYLENSHLENGEYSAYIKYKGESPAGKPHLVYVQVEDDHVTRVTNASYDVLWTNHLNPAKLDDNNKTVIKTKDGSVCTLSVLSYRTMCEEGAEE